MIGAEHSTSIIISLICSTATLFFVVYYVRLTSLSLGLPFAYLYTLLLNHSPGAYAHLARPELFVTSDAVAIGMWQTCVGSISFVMGVLIARRRTVTWKSPFFSRTSASSHRFLLFCLVGGWVFIYGLTPLRAIPSVSAIVEKGGAIWILSVMLGLRSAFSRSDFKSILFWILLLGVYPTVMLLLGGFLSYGSAAVIVATSILTVSTRSYAKIVLAATALSFLGISFFTNYFIGRDYFRSVIWSSAPLESRVDAVYTILSDVRPLDLSDNDHARALDLRLNQNYFAGLAAQRLANSEIDFVWGRSFLNGFVSIVPRVMWPNKPVTGGSGTIVADRTGLELSDTTSWGVGQVLEFYMNFGWLGLVVCFAALGWIIGRLDIIAAIADREGDRAKVIMCFLPAVALIQPIGSLVELVGGSVAAYLAARFWIKLWRTYDDRRGISPRAGFAR